MASIDLFELSGEPDRQRDKLLFMVRIRLMVLLLVIGIIAIAYAERDELAVIPWLGGFIAFVLLFNLVSFPLIRRKVHPWLLTQIHLLFDVVIITTLVHFTGSIASVFSLGYVLVIMAAAILVSETIGFLVALYATVAYGFTLYFEYTGVLANYPMFSFQAEAIAAPYFVSLTVSLSGLFFYAVAAITGHGVRMLAMMNQAMVHSEKLASLGRMAAGVVHEVNNPLSAVIAWLDSVRLDGRTATPLELNRAHGELLRATTVLKRLLTFGQAGGTATTTGQPRAVLADVAELVKYQCRQAHLDLRFEPAAELPPIRFDPETLREVTLNLALNAIDAMAPQGRGTLTIATAHDRSRNEVLVRVSDTGPGIPRDLLDQIFNPFFTTKPPGQGTGLGLAIVHNLMAKAGGRVRVETAPGRGAAFILGFPAIR